MSNIRRIVEDWPGVVTSVIIVSIFVHGVIAQALDWSWALPLHGHKAETSVVVSVYLGVASVGAIYAGFAGVIIVFGLTPSSNLFRNFRIEAGKRMVSNWISILSSAFFAAAVSLVAASVESLGQRFIGSFLFELGFLLLLHSAIRSLWLMRKLLKLVSADDQAARKRDLTEQLGSPF